MSGLEVLGIIASVAQLTGMVYSISKQLYEVGDALSKAPSDIKDLAQDLETFAEELTLLSALFQSQKNVHQFSNQVFRLTAKIIGDCARICGKIDGILQKLRGRGLMRRVRWVYREKEILKLLGRLRDLKLSLLGTLGVLSALKADVMMDSLGVGDGIGGGSLLVVSERGVVDKTTEEEIKKTEHLLRNIRSAEAGGAEAITAQKSSVGVKSFFVPRVDSIPESEYDPMMSFNVLMQNTKAIQSVGSFATAVSRLEPSSDVPRDTQEEIASSATTFIGYPATSFKSWEALENHSPREEIIVQEQWRKDAIESAIKNLKMSRVAAESWVASLPMPPKIGAKDSSNLETSSVGSNPARINNHEQQPLPEFNPASIEAFSESFEQKGNQCLGYSVQSCSFGNFSEMSGGFGNLHDELELTSCELDLQQSSGMDWQNANLSDFAFDLCYTDPGQLPIVHHPGNTEENSINLTAPPSPTLPNSKFVEYELPFVNACFARCRPPYDLEFTRADSVSPQAPHPPYLELGRESGLNESQHRRVKFKWSESNLPSQNFELAQDKKQLWWLARSKLHEDGHYHDSPIMISWVEAYYHLLDTNTANDLHITGHGVAQLACTKFKQSSETFKKTQLARHSNDDLHLDLVDRIQEIVQVMETTLNFKTGALFWVCLFHTCQEVFHYATANNISTPRDIIEQLSNIAILVSRYNVMENVYQQWPGMSLETKYQDLLVDLCASVLKYLSTLLDLVNEDIGYDCEQWVIVLEPDMERIVKADRLCRSFSFAVMLDDETMKGVEEVESEEEDDEEEMEEENYEGAAVEVVGSSKRVLRDIEEEDPGPKYDTRIVAVEMLDTEGELEV